MNEFQSKEVFFPKLRVKDDKEITSGFEFGPDNGKDFFWISNGKAMYQERLKITIYCSFEFGNFPFDSHQCNLSISISITPLNMWNFYLLQYCMKIMKTRKLNRLLLEMKASLLV